MEIKIPTKNGDVPYTRAEMEQLLRENLLSKNHMYIRKFAFSNYNLHTDYYIAAPIIVILHWLLDRMIDDSKNKDTIKIVGEKMGLSTNRSGDSFKIKGFSPKEDNTEYMSIFTKQLANFISRKQALQPNDNEGISLEELERFIEPDISGEIVTPNPPPGVSIEEQNIIAPILVNNKPPVLPMPPTPVRKPRGRPVKSDVSTLTPQPTQVSNELSLDFLLKSMRVELGTLQGRIENLENTLSVMQMRIFSIEEKIRA